MHSMQAGYMEKAQKYTDKAFMQIEKLRSMYCTSCTHTPHSLSSYGCQAFAVAGPTAWNSLSDDLRYLTLSTDSFRRLLKTLFSEY